VYGFYLNDKQLFQVTITTDTTFLVNNKNKSAEILVVQGDAFIKAGRIQLMKSDKRLEQLLNNACVHRILVRRFAE
jgi:hypothetical protein